MDGDQEQQPDYISKVLQFIATNDYDNILLAITIAQSFKLDIVQEVAPLLSICKEGFPKVEAPTSLEERVILFLQKTKINISRPPNSKQLHSLLFCQNIKELSIDLKGQPCPYDFKHLNIKELALKNCSTWPLENAAIEHLAKAELQKLIINSQPLFEANHAFVVPKELGKIRSLYKLDLEHANLKAIPTELLALDKLDLLTFHTEQEDLDLPDKIFSLPQLRWVYLDSIPSNTFRHIGPNVKFKIRKPSFRTFWQLSVWKKDSERNWDADLKDPFLFFLEKTVLLAKFCLYQLILRSDTKTITSYYIRAAFLSLLSLILFPIVVILFITINFWKMPEWYKKHPHNSVTGGIIYSIARLASPNTGSIEGLGPMGCLGGLLFLTFFVFSDYILPFLARIFFLPLAIIIGTIGLLIEPIWSLSRRN